MGILQRACENLKADGVVVMPTDTLYGMAALVESSRGIQRLYVSKQRQKSKPIAICLSKISPIEEWVNLPLSAMRAVTFKMAHFNWPLAIHYGVPHVLLWLLHLHTI